MVYLFFDENIKWEIISKMKKAEWVFLWIIIIIFVSWIIFEVKQWKQFNGNFKWIIKMNIYSQYFSFQVKHTFIYVLYSFHYYFNIILFEWNKNVFLNIFSENNKLMILYLHSFLMNFKKINNLDLFLQVFLKYYFV